MGRESRLFFTAMVRENLPVSVIVDTDFVLANDRLARALWAGTPFRIPATQDHPAREQSLRGAADARPPYSRSRPTALLHRLLSGAHGSWIDSLASLPRRRLKVCRPSSQMSVEPRPFDNFWHSMPMTRDARHAMHVLTLLALHWRVLTSSAPGAQGTGRLRRLIDPHPLRQGSIRRCQPNR